MTLVEVRTAGLARVGPIDGYTDGKLIPRYCGIGAWNLTVPGSRLDAEKVAALEEGGGIISTHPDGEVLLSGPLTTMTWNRSATTGEDGVWELSGISDEVTLADRLIYPDPTNVASNQAADAYDNRTGTAETVMRGYVNSNAAAGLLVRRNLTVEADFGRGAAVASSYRFTSLLVACQEIALAGNIGFRVVQLGSLLVFQVTEPDDLSGDIRLSFEAGTLRSMSLSRSAPDVTRVVVAGGGEGTARVFREVGSATAEADWGRRIERAQDRRDTVDTAVLDQAGAETLAAGAAKAGLKVEPVDTEQTKFGRDYRLGDRITAGPLADTVREVVITLGRDEKVEPVVGDPSATNTPDLYVRLGKLERAQARRATAD